MKYTELDTHIKNAFSGINGESFSALYLVFGEDDYLVQSAEKKFKNIVENEFADFNFSVADATDGASNIVSLLNTFPTFDKYKVVFVPNFNAKLSQKDSDVLAAYFKDPCESSILVAEASGDALKDLRKIKCRNDVDCARLDDASLSVEIAKLMNETPKREITKSAERELITATLGSMSRIACEIQKLKAYCDGVINQDDVKEIVPKDTDFQIYDLSNAVSEKNWDKALSILGDFMQNGTKPTTVISLMYGHYRNMLHIELHKNDSAEEIATLLGIKPGAIYHIKKVSSNYSQIRLKKSVDYLHNLQCDILSGRRTETSALNEAVLQLLSI
ncbi:MAG: DNA polymerase III subunit delta [Clostridia bacterium]